MSLQRRAERVLRLLQRKDEEWAKQLTAAAGDAKTERDACAELVRSHLRVVLRAPQHPFGQMVVRFCR